MLFRSEKDKLVKRQGQLYKRKHEIQNRLDEIEETAAPAKLNTLQKAHRNDIILKAENTRIRIPENLEITLPFSCGHVLKTTLGELFKLQTRFKSDTQLLQFWERTIAAHESHAKLFRCPQCQREHKKRLNNPFQPHNAKPIGGVRVTVEVI